MHFRPGTLGLLVVGAGLAGCTQTGGLRAVTPSEVKTTASVGDKPLPTVAGLPGDEHRAGDALPATPRVSSARISGRVYDDQGEPVRNAVVRLAMTGAAGGRAVHATTDPSGGFTLRGMRPGSSCTIIAEYQGEQGMMTGRAEAEAPETGVQIHLHSRDVAAGSEANGVAAALNRSRVRAVARAEDGEADEAEDLPEPEAPRPSPTRSASVKPRLDTTGDDRHDEDASGWSQQGSVPKARASARPIREEPVESEDDGDNPLPPAREISKVSAQMDDPYPAEEDEPGALPDGLVDQTSGDARDGSQRARKSTRAAASPVERARPTWSDVVTESRRGPVDAALSQTSAAVATTATVAAKAPAPKPSPAPRTAAPARERTTPYCDFDADEQRMIDFAKVDVDGKLVSIRDFDADLILLDFWGSWCAPCRTSIPHLKELQDRLGGKKLQVVSVAYEQIAPADRGAKLKELGKELGINYPILVAGLQDDDAVRSALRVWFYPTMILLDRDGRIVRREQGATPLTLANIDRAIAEHLERESKPQYAKREPKGRPTATR